MYCSKLLSGLQLPQPTDEFVYGGLCWSYLQLAHASAYVDRANEGLAGILCQTLWQTLHCKLTCHQLSCCRLTTCQLCQQLKQHCDLYATHPPVDMANDSVTTLAWSTTRIPKRAPLLVQLQTPAACKPRQQKSNVCTKLSTAFDVHGIITPLLHQIQPGAAASSLHLSRSPPDALTA